MKRTALRIGIFCAVLAAAAGTAAGISRKTSDLQQKQPEILSLPVDSGGEKEYVLGEEDGMVVVYEEDGHTVYERTDITVSHLQEELQEEIKSGKQIKDNRELYGFLEAYSS